MDPAGPVRYRERLTPPWWLWLLVVALTATVAVAYGAAYGAAVGWLVFVPSTALVALALVVTSPVVSVDDAVFRAGRARLPVSFAGAATPLDAAEARAARSVDADARAYLLLRTWTTARAVKVEVTDEEDPHPYWLVSVRRPERVAAALDSVRMAG